MPTIIANPAAHRRQCAMAARKLPPDWADLSDEELLPFRLSDLPLRIEGTVLEGRIRQLQGRQPLVTNTAEMEPLRSLRYSLAHHYRGRRRHHGLDHPEFYDRDLRRLFSDAPEYANNMTAAQFLGKMRRPVRRLVASWTGIYQYTIDRVLENMIVRCKELKLRLAVPEEQARHEFTVLLTVQTMNYLHSGRHRVAM